MAELLKPNGEKITGIKPGNAQSGFSLDELYRLVDCETLQMVYLADGRQMWVDEDAKCKERLPDLNREATRLLAEAGGLTGDVVLGNALICEEGEVL